MAQFNNFYTFPVKYDRAHMTRQLIGKYLVDNIGQGQMGKQSTFPNTIDDQEHSRSDA